MLRRRNRRSLGWFAVFAVSMLVLAACSQSADEPQASGGAEDSPQEETGGAGEEAEEQAAPVTGSFKLGHVSSISIYDVVPVITNERLKAQGWDVEDVIFARTELTPQALAQNNIQMAIALYLEPLRTIQAGGDANKIRWIMENNGSEFIIVARGELETCQDMDGQRFGIHGETSTVSIAAVNWLRDECGVDPNVLVIPGGENRIVALENGELDATLVQLGDWLALKAVSEPGEFRVVESGTALGFSGAGYWVNTDFLEANRDVVVAYVAETLRTFRTIHDDPSVLEDAVRRHVDVPDETVEEAVREYLDPGVVGLAPVDGGTPDVLNSVIEYFTAQDELDPGLDISQFYDRTIIEDALEYLEMHP